jgi:hypothetical protein
MPILTLALSPVALAAGRPATLYAAPAPLASLTIQTFGQEHALPGVAMGGAAGGIVI